MSVLTSSVGKGGVNRTGDVRLVQRLLNASLATAGRPVLADDGIVGPKTLAAIDGYQRANGLPADGRVDPNGPTLRHLLAGLTALLEAGVRAPDMPAACAVPLTGPPLPDVLTDAVRRLRD